MKYILLGLVVTLVLTSFMVALLAKAVFVELKERSVRGKSGCRD